MRKNKAINRGVIPLFAEPNVTEWACCVRQRVERWMKWTKWIAFREDEKWKEKQRQFEGESEREVIEQTQFQRIGKTQEYTKNCFELSLHYTLSHQRKIFVLKNWTVRFAIYTLSEWALCLVEYWDGIEQIMWIDK